MKHFSLKELLTKSATELYGKNMTFSPYISSNRQVSRMKLEGVDFQHRMAHSFKYVIGEELGTTFPYQNILTIHLSHDIVCENKIIEVKSVFDNRSNDYLQKSIFQCAVYKAFLMKSDGVLKTSKFHVENGNPLIQKRLRNKNIPYILMFGTDFYEIEVINPDAIVNFFIQKALSTQCHDSAMRFDALNAFTYLQKAYRFKRIFTR